MMHAYIDPHSYIYLNDGLFHEEIGRKDDYVLAFWHFLKRYCLERGILLQTIDRWDEKESNSQDVYVSLEHKNFLKRVYWSLKNKRYPVRVPLGRFGRKILFQFEPPFIMPEVYVDIKRIIGLYDTSWLAWKVDDPRARYFHYWQTYDRVLEEYWENSERGFLVMINSNVPSRMPKKFLFTLVSTGKFPRTASKELISERSKAALFFSRTNEIDIYGSGWDKEYALREVYRGRAVSKYATLSRYRFSLCYENSSVPGYITEKIFDCLFVGTIPIYLGAPDITEYIPKDCFIDRRDFKSYEELRTFLKSLSESEITAYKENGRRFLESERYKPFTKEYFAKTFLEACVS